MKKNIQYPKLKKKTLLLLILLSILFFIVYFVFYINPRVEKNIDLSQKFYSSSIIKSVFVSNEKNKMNHIILSDYKEYYFFNWKSFETELMPFRLINSGDSIYKPALSDTMLIIKMNGKKYRFYYQDNK